MKASEFQIVALEIVSELIAKLENKHDIYSKAEVTNLLSGIYQKISNADTEEHQENVEPTFNKEQIINALEDMFSEWNMEEYQDIEVDDRKIGITFDDNLFLRDVKQNIGYSLKNILEDSE